MAKLILALIMFLVAASNAQDKAPHPRPRAPELGIKVGVLPAGPLDAITDVVGVEVGQTTIIRATTSALE